MVSFTVTVVGNIKQLSLAFSIFIKTKIVAQKMSR